MKIEETINDIYTSGGVFQALNSLNKESLSWLTLDTAKLLDNEYYIGFSGEKTISPYLEKMIAKYPDTYLSKIAYMLELNYGDKWRRLYEALVTTEYNPIENYNSNEIEKYNSKITSKSENDSSTYGFNSGEPTPESKLNNTNTTEGSKNDNYRELKRSGNIGVTTSQQMLESEVVLRNRYNFYNVVLNDVDSMLVLQIYI